MSDAIPYVTCAGKSLSWEDAHDLRQKMGGGLIDDYDAQTAELYVAATLASYRRETNTDGGGYATVPIGGCDGTGEIRNALCAIRDNLKVALGAALVRENNLLAENERLRAALRAVPNFCENDDWRYDHAALLQPIGIWSGPDG